MNILDQRMLLGINSALNQKKIDVATLLKDISLQDFLNKLQSHSVESLIYSSLSDPYNLDSIDKETAQLWKKTTLFSTIYQQQHITQMKLFFKACNEKNVPVIALKGLLLRDLYPIPTTRTMSDADILVHKDNIDALRSLLIELGYTEEPSNDHHLNFSKPDHFNIEVHWTLNTELTNKNTKTWEDQIWNHCQTTYLDNIPILSLSLEDHLFFLCLHMLSHIKYYGFGIRQLCDFYLFVEHYNTQIDWNYFNQLTSKLNISAFICYIMSACQSLFHMGVPKDYVFTKTVSPKQLKYFITVLMQGGVYGFENTDHSASVQLSRIDKDRKLRGISKIIFPNKARLSNHYSYINNYPYLYPIAFVQNLWRLVTRGDFSIQNKFSILFLSSRRLKQREHFLKEIDS